MIKDTDKSGMHSTRYEEMGVELAPLSGCHSPHGSTPTHWELPMPDSIRVPWRLPHVDVITG